MAVKIGPVIGVEGEKVFRAAFKEMIAQAREMDSEMNKLTSSFSKNDSAISKNAKIQEQLRKEIEKQKDVVEKAKKIHEEAIKAEQRTGVAYLDSKDKLAKLNQTREEARQKILKLIDEYGYEHPLVQGAIAGYNELGKEIKTAEDRVEAMSASVHRAGEVTATWGTAVNDGTAKLHELENQLRSLPKDLQVVGEEMKQWGDALSSVGDKMSMYITTPMLTAGAAAVKWASDFTDGLAKIYTIADESKKPMAEMRAELVQLSNQSGYSLEDLAEAEYQAVSASVDTAKAVDFLTDATKLARGGFTSTTQAVDLLTTVINAYGYEAEDAAYISDVLLRTQNDGKTVVDELAHSMGTVIPTAANYNVSLEQLAAAYATMTKQGVNTSRATTFLNAMFTELEKESSKISKVLDEETGKSFAQLMGEGKSLAEVLKILYDSVDQDNEEFQKLFGNIRSGKAASALLTDDFAILNYEVERMADATGQTAHAMEVLETPSLKAKRALQQLKNSGMELGSQLIDRLSPAFEKVITSIKNVTDYVAKFTDKSWDMILLFGSIVTATGPVLSIAGKATSAIGGLLTAIAAGSLPLSTTIGLVVGLTEVLAGLFVAGEIGAEQRRAEAVRLYELNDAQKALLASQEEMRTSYEQTKIAIQDKEATTLGELQYAEILVGKYNELIDGEGKVAEGKQLLADTYLNELAVALGMEKEDLLTLIDDTGRFSASIYESIDAMKERAKMQAYTDLYTEAIKRQAEAQDNLTRLEGEWKAAAWEAAAADEALENQQNLINKAIEDGNPVTVEMTDKLTELSAQAEVTRSKEQELAQAMDNARQDFNTATVDMNNAEARLSQGVDNEVAKQVSSVSRGSKLIVGEAESMKRNVENQKPDGWSLGTMFGEGFAGGIRNMISTVAGMAAQMASSASGAARSNLQIRSPSRVTREIGEYFSEGFALGIKDEMANVNATVNMLTSSALGGISDITPPSPTQTISAPINIQLTIEGNVDGDDRGFARNIAGELANLIRRDNEVFA